MPDFRLKSPKGQVIVTGDVQERASLLSQGWVDEAKAKPPKPVEPPKPMEGPKPDEANKPKDK